MLAPATPTISGFTAGAHQSAWAGSLNLQFAWVGRGTAPFEHPLTGGHPLETFPRTRYLGQRAAEKPSTFAKFMGLCLTPITSIWRAS